ncbi:MAG: FAD-dependent oxidoreductase [Thermoplasmatales archaeon]
MIVGIVGGGAAGLYAAYLLNKVGVQTIIIEKQDRLGGNIYPVEIDGYQLDLGFQVFNPKFYPLVSSMFKELNVETENTDMSFAIEVNDSSGNFGWGSSWGAMMSSVLRYRSRAVKFLLNALLYSIEAKRSESMPECPKDVLDYFLRPLATTLWSVDQGCEDEINFQFVHNFLRNHQMFRLFSRAKWLRLRNASFSYLESLSKKLTLSRIYLNTPALAVETHDGSVSIVTQGDKIRVDKVVLALDADYCFSLITTAGLLASNLNAPTYANTPIVVHKDTSVLPKIRGSWNFVKKDGLSLITYDLYRLQNVPFLVTLSNRVRINDPLFMTTLRHPLINVNLLSFRSALREIQGKGGVYYCGAYFGNCFHEDAYVSAKNAVDRLLCSTQS